MVAVVVAACEGKNTVRLNNEKTTEPIAISRALLIRQLLSLAHQSVVVG